jgi:hypothetical protein
MGVVMEGLLQSAMSDSLRKGQGLGVNLIDLPANFLAKLLENASLSRGDANQFRRGLADAIDRLAHQPLVKVRAGDRIRHRSTGRTARAMHPQPLGNGLSETWQVLTDDTDALEDWPVDQIEAQGETEPLPLPGGRQGSSPGAPFVSEEHLQAKANFFSSAEGQAVLAKSIRPGPPPASFCGFAEQRAELRKAAAERGFRPGRRVVHLPSGKRGRFVVAHKGHGIIEDEETGRPSIFPLEELAESLVPGVSSSGKDGDGTGPYEDSNVPGFNNSARARDPQLKTRRIRSGVTEFFLSR